MKIADRRVKHGCAKRGSPTRLYQVWQNMKCRCNNPHSKEYKYYGERGIAVCEEWSDFGLFQKWAYENGYDETAKRGECTLDRIDLSKGYEPTNCRWVDAKTQANNRRRWGTVVRNHKMITWRFDGEEHTVAEWSDITGISRNILRSRYHKGWSVERILTTPTIIPATKEGDGE